MKKLASKPFPTKFTIENGDCVIWAKKKGDIKLSKAFVCHISCIDLIKSADNLVCENVVIQPYKAV